MPLIARPNGSLPPHPCLQHIVLAAPFLAAFHVFDGVPGGGGGDSVGPGTPTTPILDLPPPSGAPGQRLV